MAFDIQVKTPHGDDVIANVVAFGPEALDKEKLVVFGENDEQLAVYRDWISAKKVQG